MNGNISRSDLRNLRRWLRYKDQRVQHATDLFESTDLRRQLRIGQMILILLEKSEAQLMDEEL